METPERPVQNTAGMPSASGGNAAANDDYALRDIWYYALPGTALSGKKLAAKTVLGEQLVFGRGADGSPFCLVDLCPHRGMPLRYGTFDGEDIQCCYHGWRFAPDGRLTCIPSLAEGLDFDYGRVRVKSYPCREAGGNVWVWMGAGAGPFTPDRDVPRLPDTGDGTGPLLPKLMETQMFPCPVDHAVMGLMDPAHGPYVHTSWWWRPGGHAYQKEKHFVPSELGFTIARHQPSSNSRLYRFLGGTPETEISFRLPGVRIEHIQAGRHHVIGLTAVTPVGPEATEVNQIFYWTLPWLSVAKPVLKRVMRTFLGQDRDIVARQQDGLARKPPLRLIDDADTPAKWYLRLKAEYARAQKAGRPFVNPVPDTVLRWKS